MGFLFGLFRFLTWGNIIVQGFFMMIMVILLIMNPIAAIGGLMLFGFIMYHNILCLQLQRALKDPTYPLSKIFSTTILVVSVLTFFYSILTLNRTIEFMMIPMDEFMKLMRENSGNDPNITPEIMTVMRNMMIFLMFSYSIAVGANCVISSIFLNRWKKMQPEEEIMPEEE